MQAAGFGCLGFFLGAIVGGIIGVVLGFVWTKVFHTSDFEGYSGMLVFFTFMPIGIFAGGILGAAGLATIASRSEPAPTLPADSKKPIE
jgi:MFS family permease